MPVANRKRRLSDPDSQGAPKRPKNVLSGPRLHAVSDPLPSTFTLSTWFERNFGIPCAPTVEEPDLSLPFDVDLYDYSKYTTNVLSAVTKPCKSTSPTIDPHNNFDTFSLATHSCAESKVGSTLSPKTLLPAPQKPHCALSVSTNDFDYNELFRELEDTTYIAQGVLSVTLLHPGANTRF